LFWDTNIEEFDPRAYPRYAIERVLEYGDEDGVAWMRRTFGQEQIQEVLRTDRNLTPRSANFWALLFGLPADRVAALKTARSPSAFSTSRIRCSFRPRTSRR
jgi:hypothetical protein